jgi:hypothetical protein
MEDELVSEGAAAPAPAPAAEMLRGSEELPPPPPSEAAERSLVQRFLQ